MNMYLKVQPSLDLLYKKIEESLIFLDMYLGIVKSLCKIGIYQKRILKLAGML